MKNSFKVSIRVTLAASQLFFNRASLNFQECTGIIKASMSHTVLGCSYVPVTVGQQERFETRQLGILLSFGHFARTIKSNVSCSGHQKESF
jgi:hypothetical protein